MDKFIVVAINNSEARFFTLEEAEWPEYESGPNLVEQENLSYCTSDYCQGFWFKITNRHYRKLKNTKYTQHQFERKFAQKVTSEIINLVRIHQGQKLILIAQPQILNLIRKSFTPTLFKNLQIQELSKDISHFSANQIHQYLAQKHLIPAYQKVFYPR
ncbi:conserved hypothetical protein [Hyella patelloides LEGE 07179]|uniref:Host attachment protein n=1 Tax=Hyella patelloides LEGE 07179 TaxID=945734 RepID=A0A563VQN9_9CYAN|nr:host attachment protein [Hyella patelloides]VEP13776.1 conserved hypothetical protein [Hyella patelloides LEGE 07179]